MVAVLVVVDRSSVAVVVFRVHGDATVHIVEEVEPMVTVEEGRVFWESFAPRV